MPEVIQSVNTLSSYRRHLATVAASMTIAGAIISGAPALADGTEILEPTSATLADGSGIIGAGVGLSLAHPGSIEIEIPPEVTVKQVLIYWDGADGNYSGAAPIIGVTTNGVFVSGNYVEGVFIGGRTFGTTVQQFTFRADITSLGLVVPGSNTIEIRGVGFGVEADDDSESRATGAGVLVIFDDGTSSTIGIFDGNDYAHANCKEPDANCLETVKRMFSFPAASSARDADLTMFFTSVEGQVSGGGARPSAVRIWVGDAAPIELIDQLSSGDGEEWDTLNLEFEIPAGVTNVEVQAFSEDVNNIGNNPASFKWLTAALSVPSEVRGGGQGCTPGYWKQSHHFADWTSPYDPDDLFSDHFEDAFPGLTMVEVADGNGGGLIALGRHTVAGLLNAANSEVSYDHTPQEVIDAFDNVYPGSKNDYEALKNEFEELNELGCPLNNSDGSNGNNGSGNQSDTDETTASSASATAASARNQSSGGGAFGVWGILALLAAGFRMNIRVDESNEQLGCE